MTAVHSRSAERAYRRFAVTAYAENDYYSACLIFAQKISDLAADDYFRIEFVIFLHMYSYTVACVALYEYLA